VAAALLTAGVGWGQPSGVPGGPGGPPPGIGPGGPAEKADPQVEAWVKTLTDKMNDPHDAIRESARAALVSVGGPALPALRQIAGGNDAKSFTARRLVQQIERAGLPGPGGGGLTGGGFGIPPGFGNPPGFGGPGAFPSPPGSPPFPGVPGTPAPGGRGTERGPANQPPLRSALDELKLDEKQRVQVEKAVEGYSTKLRGLLEDVRSGKVDRNELRDAVSKLADEATAELNRALTADQRATLERLTPRGRSLFPTPFGEPTPDRQERKDPNPPERPRTPRPNPEGGW
jgi:Spy/CpxP family protein refolding chaperone